MRFLYDLMRSALLAASAAPGPHSKASNQTVLVLCLRESLRAAPWPCKLPPAFQHSAS